MRLHKRILNIGTLFIILLVCTPILTYGYTSNVTPLTNLDNVTRLHLLKFVGKASVNTWDDLVSKGAKNVDELKAKLSPEAQKVMAGSVNTEVDELAQISEALSFDNFAKRGGKLKYVEKDMKNVQNVKKFDYVVELEGLNYPVSVKRLNTPELTPQNAYNYLSKAMSDMNSARNSLPTSDYISDNTLHYWVKNEEQAKILKQQFDQLIKDSSQSVETSRLITTVGPEYILKQVN